MLAKIRPIFYLFLLLLIFSILWLVIFQPQSITVIHSYLRNIPLDITQQTNETITTTTTIKTTTINLATTAEALNDYKRLVNYTNFEFMHLAECTKNGETPRLLVAVHTAPSNIEKRQAIRETWGKDRPEIKVLFMMAIPQKTEENTIVTQEHEKYKDIIQGNFLDTYKNLTYKHVMVLKYVVYHCPKITFLLKTDDDVFVNMPYLLSFIHEFYYFRQNVNIAKPRELLICVPMVGSPAIREENKWKVTFEEFAEEYYPPYCSGFAEIFTPDTARRIYSAAQNSRFLWVDDAFVTGIARQAANITITPLPGPISINRKEMNAVFKINNQYPDIPYPFLFGPINVDPNMVRQLWHIVSHEKIK